LRIINSYNDNSLLETSAANIPGRDRSSSVWKHLFHANRGNDGASRTKPLAARFPPINAKTIAPCTRVSKENPKKIHAEPKTPGPKTTNLGKIREKAP
jgi:hypothetical protein